MKKTDILALFFYLCGILYMLDWIIFEKNNDLYDDFPTMKAKYISRFPTVIKPLIANNPQPAAIIFTVLFGVCGIVFIRNKNVIFKVLGITSFLLAFWNLFSIM